MDLRQAFAYENNTDMTSPTSLYGVNHSLISSEPASPSFHGEQHDDWNDDNYFNPLTALPTVGGAPDNASVQPDWASPTAGAALSSDQLARQPHLSHLQIAPAMQRSTSQPLPALAPQPPPQPVFTRGGRTIGTPIVSSASAPTRAPRRGGNNAANANTNQAATTTPSKKKARTNSRNTGLRSRVNNTNTARNADTAAAGSSSSPTPNRTSITKKPRRPPPTSIPLDWNPPAHLQPAASPFNPSGGQPHAPSSASGIQASTFDFAAADAANDMISPRTLVPTHFGHFGQPLNVHGAGMGQTGLQALQVQQGSQQRGWFEPNLDPRLLRMSVERMAVPRVSLGDAGVIGGNGNGLFRDFGLGVEDSRGQSGQQPYTIDAGLAVTLYEAIGRVCGECDRLRDLVNRCVPVDAPATAGMTDSPDLSDMERARTHARHHNAHLTSPHALLAPLPYTHAESPTWSLDMVPATAADVGCLDAEALDGLLEAHRVGRWEGMFGWEKRRALLAALGCAREVLGEVLD